ncbi:MAG: hypothetical protein JW967_01620 [Dehalococcoidales bacterium]|nr:hypothetical protein [Dehalococcoidales bacterium]
MPFPNYQGRKRLWTKEKVLSALSAAAVEIKGPLPCRDREYCQIKKGRYDWPSALRILEYYHSMARAWLAAGAEPCRVSMHNQDWTAAEDDYLFDYAGNYTLAAIAKHLHRTYDAVKARLNKKYHIQARGNLGYFSAAELAREYNCSCHRIRTALRDGKIKGDFDKVRNRWNIDLGDITPEALLILTAPKRTHKYQPTDLGDYEQRYGIRRKIINGKTVRIEVNHYEKGILATN